MSCTANLSLLQCACSGTAQNTVCTPKHSPSHQNAKNTAMERFRAVMFPRGRPEGSERRWERCAAVEGGAGVRCVSFFFL